MCLRVENTCAGQGAYPLSLSILSIYREDGRVLMIRRCLETENQPNMRLTVYVFLPILSPETYTRLITAQGAFRKIRMDTHILACSVPSAFIVGPKSMLGARRSTVRLVNHRSSHGVVISARPRSLLAIPDSPLPSRYLTFQTRSADMACLRPDIYCPSARYGLRYAVISGRIAHVGARRLRLSIHAKKYQTHRLGTSNTASYSLFPGLDKN